MSQPTEFVLFQEEHKDETKTGFPFFLIAFLYFVQILITFFLFYLSFRSLGFGFAFIASSIPLLLIILIQRFSPVVALILFLFKKKEGWIFVTFLNIITIVLNGNAILQSFYLPASGNKAIKLVVAGHAVTLGIAIVITFLMLLPAITKKYEITQKTKIQTALVAVVFALVYYYFAGSIINIFKPN